MVPSLRLLLFLLMLVPLETSQAGPALRLRTTADRYDPNAAANGDFVIELEGESGAAVRWTSVSLHGTHGRFPMGLYRGRIGSVEQAAGSGRIPSGRSLEIFRVPMAAALLQGGNTRQEGWHWDWSGSPPRGAPSASPIHSRARGSLAVEVTLDPSGLFWAEAVVGGANLRSEPIVLPVVPLALEEVETVVRFTTARYLRPAREEIEFRFQVLRANRGQLRAGERSVVLPVGNGEHLLRALSARSAGSQYEYACNPRPVRLSVCRLRDPLQGGAPRLVLLRYESATATPLP